MTSNTTSDTLTTLATLVGAALKTQDEILATAESCTGGGIAEAVTRVAGSSGWFDRGFVTYSNRAKIESLGVDAGTLAKSGAVSEDTARAMAQGALAKSGATLALSVTGVAGPAGGTAEKPVGTVCFAWARKNGKLASERRQFAGDRDAVRRQSVIHALQGILRLLDDTL
jgi:nicotinamide-nucleotide amidase